MQYYQLYYTVYMCSVLLSLYKLFFSNVISVHLMKITEILVSFIRFSYIKLVAISFIYLSTIFMINVACAGNSNILQEKNALFRLQPTDNYLGDKSADIILLEYSSLTCPHCKTFHDEVLPHLKKEYIDKGKVLYIYRDYIMNQPSLIGSQLSYCSGNYFKYLEMFFTAQEQWLIETDHKQALVNLAKAHGMSEEKIKSCFADKSMEEFLYNRSFKANNLLQVNKTPTFFLNAQEIDGKVTYAVIKDKIDLLLKQDKLIKK